MIRYLFVVLLLLGSFEAAAQELETVRNRSFQVKYNVPSDWAVTQQRTDSVEVVRYHRPADDAVLWVGQLRGRHARLRPQQALERLLRHLGTVRYEEHRVTSHGLDFLESTGTYYLNGRELRYDARVTNYRGHVLLVYVYATPAAFNAQAPLLHQVLDSLTPLQDK